MLRQEIKQPSGSLYSVPELKEKGWTKTMITKLMPEHDDERTNPKYKCASPMKLYEVRRVSDCEKGDLWKEMRQKSLKRIEAGKKASVKALNTKLENNLKKYEDITFEVTKDIKPEQLTRQAIGHYNTRGFDRSDLYSPLKRKNMGQDFLDRITVNYIRHMLTDYDYVVGTPRNHVGVAEARELIKDKVLDAIAEAYPHLSSECSNQSVRQCQFQN